MLTIEIGHNSWCLAVDLKLETRNNNNNNNSDSNNIAVVPFEP